jgi:hypothetical protein
MALLPPAIDYSDKDFDGLRARAFDLVQSVFPDWTDDAAANFGNLLVELHCFTGDVLHFYQDQQARETRIAWVQLRRNMIALAKLLNYTLQPATPGRADVRIRLLNPAALSGIVAPVGVSNVILRTAALTSPVRGEIELPIGSIYFDRALGETEKVFPWVHAVTAPVYAVAASGRAEQEVILPDGPFLDDGSEAVWTTGQGAFARVPSFWGLGPSDLVYRVEVDQNDKGSVIFGDGRNGARAAGTINTRYRIGGGLVGNVEAGGLNRSEASWVDPFGVAAELEITNVLRAEGGYPREEVAAARVNAPASTRVLTRTVCREDFEINAKRVAGVGRALMLTCDDQPGIPENHGRLYVLPITGGTAPSTMVDAVRVMVTETYPHTVTFQLEVLPTAFLTVNVKATVFLRPNTVPSVTGAAIRAGLADYFSPMLANGEANPNVDFGYNYRDADDLPAGEIPWSDLFDVVRDTAGVRKVEGGTFLLNGARDDVGLALHLFPRLSTVELVNGDTGGAF